MKVKILSVLVGFLSILGVIPHAEGAWTLHKGRLCDVCELATMSAQEHFEAGAEAYSKCDWQEAMQQFNITSYNFPTSPYGQEAYYFLGVSYYFLQEYDFANQAFSDYLKVQCNPRYFQSAVEFKFAIAEQLNGGARCRIFRTKQLPKWWSGKNLALKIYDEVIAAVPCHELAAKALISKGALLWSWEDYRGAIDAFQMVIRRFPKGEMAADCYVYISQVYLEQAECEFQNSDILAFAEINVSKFERDFPREERVCIAAENVMAIKEVYAAGLYETGRFYERTCKPGAAIIYYNDVIRQFPTTAHADCSRERILCLDPDYCEPVICEETTSADDADEGLEDFVIDI